MRATSLLGVVVLGGCLGGEAAPLPATHPASPSAAEAPPIALPDVPQPGPAPDAGAPAHDHSHHHHGP